MHGRRRDAEELLHVSLGRRLAVDQRVVVDERQVLSLSGSKTRLHRVLGVSITRMRGRQTWYIGNQPVLERHLLQFNGQSASIDDKAI